tara:strand:+ start:48 stop:617 length:570 start_codon:yes stop_codon:yes gene_type:complete
VNLITLTVNYPNDTVWLDPEFSLTSLIKPTSEGIDMATTIPGETYLGETLVQPLSEVADVTIYVWPLRCLNTKAGGPTFGVDVGGVEIIRFDPHGPGGHWHARGYDKLGAGNSHIDFPDDVQDSNKQVEWSLNKIREEIPQLLEQAGYPTEAKSVDETLLEKATRAVAEHLKKEGDLRPQAIALGALKE